jgi:hypothetical protein
MSMSMSKSKQSEVMIFEEVIGSKSNVWNFFTRSTCKKMAKCNVCGSFLKIGGGSTKTMHDHLVRVHENKSSASSKRNVDENLKQERQPKILKYINGPTLGRDVLAMSGGGIGTGILKNVKDRLDSFVPTSVEAERAFSTSSFFCTKIRNRMNDETINALTFLKFYFNKV